MRVLTALLVVFFAGCGLGDGGDACPLIVYVLRDPVSTGACTGLDAQACSRHDNCSAWYLAPSPGTTTFDHCAGEAPAAR